MAKSISVDNPTNLPLIPLDDLHDFQGDLKVSDTPLLRKLAASILDHHLFIGKAVFYEDGIPFTEDGHQTIRALKMLESNGWKHCEVISYALVDGQMQPTETTHYDQIMVPCQVIVPVGSSKEDRLKDAAAKLVQINSQYAAWNPGTSFFTDLAFTADDLDALLLATHIPDFKPEAAAASTSDYEQAFAASNDDTAIYPVVRRYSEGYRAIIIVSENDTDLTAVQEALGLDKARSYKNENFGQTYVVGAQEFLARWKER